MPLIAILFLVFALFMLARVPRIPGDLAGMILCLFLCILGLTGYIARFGNYQLEGFMLIIPLDQTSWA